MIDAMKQALQALEDTMDRFCMADWDDTKVSEAITAIRAAIEAAERADAVWIRSDQLQQARIAPQLCRVEPAYREGGFVPLYAHPPAITAEMVEKAAKTLADLNYPVSGWPSGFDAAFQEHFRKHARAALEAALGVKHAE